MSRILCLNKSYIPIRLTTKFSAIGKMYTEMASAIYINGDKWEEKNWDKWLQLSLKDVWKDDQEFINSIRQRIAIPKVIRYTKYDRIPKVTLRLSRKSIYERDKYTCYLCGEQFSEGKLSIDHVIPISRGGRNDWNNMATCCKNCNWKKEDKLLSELGIKPKFMPYKPQLSNIVKLKSSVIKYDPDWKLFGF